MAVRSRDEGGAVVVEMVILLPLLMFLLAIVVQLAVFFHARGVLTAGAREGLDAARVENGSEDSGRLAAREFFQQSEGGFSLVDVEVDRDSGTDRAEVTVVGEVMSLVPGLTPTITITVDAPVERLTP